MEPKKTHIVKKLFLMLLSLNYINDFKAQTNLVPNPSFEDTVNCPVTTDEIFNAQHWNSPTFGTPDYFNACNSPSNIVGVPTNFFGFQNAYNGTAYAGFTAMQLPNIREYIQVKLDSVLQPNMGYCLSYYLSLAEVSGFSIKQIGVYFSTSPINMTTNANLPFVPQIENTTFIFDSNSWTKISANYFALGGEQYMVLGDFKNDTNTDTLHYSNNSHACYYFIDSIEIKRCSSVFIKELNAANCKIYPNPATVFFNIEFSNKGKHTINLYNHMWQKLSEQIITDTKSTKIDIDKYESGLLFIQIISDNETQYYQLLKQ